MYANSYAEMIAYCDHGELYLTDKGKVGIDKYQLWTDAIFDQWRECVADYPFPVWE